MTTKRTHGPCTCKPHGEKEARDAMGVVRAHLPDCPSLYPAQQEPDALTRLARHVRDSLGGHDETPWASKALDLISEAREEQRKALVRAKNEGLEKAATRLQDLTPETTIFKATRGILIRAAADIRAMVEPNP